MNQAERDLFDPHLYERCFAGLRLNDGPPPSGFYFSIPKPKKNDKNPNNETCKVPPQRRKTEKKEEQDK